MPISCTFIKIKVTVPVVITTEGFPEACIAGNILARLVHNRLYKHIDRIGVIPESKCGFLPNRGTTDMIFSLRQLQEKCKLQGQDLYLLFIDLTKDFATVTREALWRILEKVGCPKHFVDIIRSFHVDMKVSVREGIDKSPTLFHQWHQAGMCSCSYSILYILFNDASCSLS
jgi:hypothetical protein